MFSFALKNKAGDIETWHIDLKKEGKVGKGEAPEGMKTDGKSNHLWFSQTSRRENY